MKDIKEYTTDELITELRKRDDGYLVGVIPISNIGQTFNCEPEELTQEELDIIQCEFMESPHLDDVLEYALDSIQISDEIEIPILLVKRNK
jgi:hypothetical protein